MGTMSSVKSAYSIVLILGAWHMIAHVNIHNCHQTLFAFNFSSQIKKDEAIFFRSYNKQVAKIHRDFGISSRSV